MGTVNQDPLAPYTRLSPSIYLHDPPTSAPAQTRPTIVLLFWYGAAPRALAKYVTEYTRLAPTARILFILSGLGEFVWTPPTEAAHRRRLQPAIDVIRSATENGPVFVHAFSNGGVYNLAYLSLGYRHVTSLPLAISYLILDSAPGRMSSAGSVAALAYGLPKNMGVVGRMLGLVGLWTWVLLQFVLHIMGLAKGDDFLAFSREALLDPSLLATQSGRCYIFSDKDAMVKEQDVEEHAACADAKDGVVVERERFYGSPHVGHMRADPVRYWGIVERCLKKGKIG